MVHINMFPTNNRKLHSTLALTEPCTVNEGNSESNHNSNDNKLFIW